MPHVPRHDHDRKSSTWGLSVTQRGVPLSSGHVRSCTSIYNLINLTTYSGDKLRIINTTVSAGHRAKTIRTEVGHVHSVDLMLSKANRSVDLELDLPPSRSYRYARQDGILVSQAKIKVVKLVPWPYRSPQSFESIWINLLLP